MEAYVKMEKETDKYDRRPKSNHDTNIVLGCKNKIITSAMFTQMLGLRTFASHYLEGKTHAN